MVAVERDHRIARQHLLKVTLQCQRQCPVVGTLDERTRHSTPALRRDGHRRLIGSDRLGAQPIEGRVGIGLRRAVIEVSPGDLAIEDEPETVRRHLRAVHQLRGHFGEGGHRRHARGDHDRAYVNSPSTASGARSAASPMTGPPRL